MQNGHILLRALAGTIAGVGAIYLCATGRISSEAAVAILTAEIAFFVGEYNGRRTR